MYRINATPVHCFARGCAHRDPRLCLMRVPPFYIKKSTALPACSSAASAAARRFQLAASAHSAHHSSRPEPHHSLCRARVCDRLAKSRATGQSHRDSEREHIIYLLTAIENGRLENALLFVIFSHAYKRDRMLRFGATHSIAASSSYALPHQWHVGCDSTEDNVPQLRPIMYPVSQPCQLMLGQSMVSGATASALLELLMHRRNMWGTTHAVRANTCDPDGRRRRRPPYRAATTAADAEAIVHFATRLYCRELDADHTHKHAVNHYVQQRLGNFAMAAYNVDHIEAIVNPVYSLSQYVHEPDYASEALPRSPTTPDTAEFGSPLNMRRVDGAKRCTRCGVLKFAGSGHGRSKCADGLSISSRVPYPASPTHAQQ